MTVMARPKIEWTDQMLEELAENYAIASDNVLSKRLQVSVSTMRRKAHEMELVKSSVGRNCFEVWNTVERMFGKYSNKEIAKEAHVSERTVRRISKRLKLKLSKDERSMLISRAVTKVIKSEKRRILFGFEQRTNRFIGKDKVRTRVFRMLAEHGYIVITGSMIAYHSASMRRYEHIEAYAVSVGFQMELWETD